MISQCLGRKLAVEITTRRRSSYSSSINFACTEQPVFAIPPGKCVTQSWNSDRSSRSIRSRASCLCGHGCMQSVRGRDSANCNLFLSHSTSSRRSNDVSKADRNPGGSWFRSLRRRALRFTTSPNTQRGSPMGSNSFASSSRSGVAARNSSRSSFVNRSSSSAASSPSTAFKKKPSPRNQSLGCGGVRLPCQTSPIQAHAPLRPPNARRCGGMSRAGTASSVY
mmetsp:Transcript_66185/g.190993  ORF Transcript_66185/g.190993 Transcript_66185/m.190993 type:complete len:223 (+) Transcript_66185:399-1067(+)